MKSRMSSFQEVNTIKVWRNPAKIIKLITIMPKGGRSGGRSSARPAARPAARPTTTQSRPSAVPSRTTSTNAPRTANSNTKPAEKSNNNQTSQPQAAPTSSGGPGLLGTMVSLTPFFFYHT